VEAEAARKDVERAAERAADQEAMQQVQAELERVRAGAAAAAAAAEEKFRAAEARAVERSTERTTERAAGEKTAQQLQAEIARVRAGAAAEVAAAEEKFRAAEVRAEQRSAERTTERATGEEAVQRVRLELEKVRSDTSAAVAAARGKASGDVAAAREAADAEIAHWRAHAADMERWARAEVSTQLLTIPIPPLGVRARIGSAESTVDALYQIDYVLEVGLAEEVESHFAPDLEFTRSLTWKVQQQAKDLSSELANLSTWYADPSEVAVAAGYAEAAADAYRAIVERIDTAVERLGSRFDSPAAEIIAVVTAMLADLRAQGLR
jgi:hypothetical protein